MKRRLAVMTPSLDGKVEGDFARGMMEVGHWCAQHDIDVMYLIIKNHPYICNARNGCVANALIKDATDLLFIDADITFMAADVVKLIEVAEEKKIVCGIYPTKNDIQHKTTYRLANPEDAGTLERYVELSGAATGFLLVRREVYEDPKMLDMCGPYVVDAIQDLELHRWYETAYLQQKDGDGKIHFMGEDAMFFMKALQVGYKIWADRTIILGHVGPKTWTLPKLNEDKSNETNT